MSNVDWTGLDNLYLNVGLEVANVKHWVQGYYFPDRALVMNVFHEFRETVRFCKFRISAASCATNVGQDAARTRNLRHFCGGSWWLSVISGIGMRWLDKSALYWQRAGRLITPRGLLSPWMADAHASRQLTYGRVPGDHSRLAARAAKKKTGARRKWDKQSWCNGFINSLVWPLDGASWHSWPLTFIAGNAGYFQVTWPWPIHRMHQIFCGHL